MKLPEKLRLALKSRLERIFRPATYHRPLAQTLAEFRAAHPLPPEGVERRLDTGLAVVVPCYGHAAFLQDTLASLAGQTYRPFQAVFVDDCSPDGASEKLHRLIRELPDGIQATLMRTPVNSGQAAAINLGVSQAQAGVICILNDDDYLMHDALEAGLAILQANPQVYMFGAHLVPFSSARPPTGLPETEKLIRTRFASYAQIPLSFFGPQDISRFKKPKDLSLSHSGMLFFKSAWQAVGGYQAQRRQRVVIHADRDFQLRLASLLPVAVTYDAAFAFWRSDSSVDRGVYS